MKFIIYDTYTIVDNPEEQATALGKIRQACRARPANYKFMPRYKNHMWDGYISLMTGWAKFPTGLLNIVIEYLKGFGYKTFEFEDHRVFAETKPITSDILNGIELRDYQVEVANIMLEKKRGVVRMATNSGKTEVMSAVLKALNMPALVLVHRKELMYQTVDRFMKRGLKNVGMIGDGIFKQDFITVAMIQTLALQMENINLENNKIFIADECHTTANTDRSFDILGQIPASYRFGMSGTPLKYDDLADFKLLAYTGEVIYELTNDYMIGEGHSAKPEITIKIMPDRHDKLFFEEAWAYAYDDLIVNNNERNEYIASHASKLDGTTLIIVNHIKHGEALKRLIKGSTFLTGSDTSRLRNDTLDYMRKGGKGVYIVTPIWDEGVDVPSIDTVILASSGKSHVKLLQRIGRGLRKKGGDNILRVLDFHDESNKHLLAHSLKRQEIYKSEKFEVTFI